MSESARNIVLVGMMGAGKTFIGEKLAKLVSHFNYIDVDEEIEKRENLKISQIFEKYSEKYFRQKETEIIKEFSGLGNQIISVGGGAFASKENIENLSKNSITFYLKATPETLFERLSANKKEVESRPMLNNELSLEKIKELLKKREKNYKKANLTIDTDGKPAYTILDDIISGYENYVK